MNRALYAAASGMAAQQANLDTISDNLANADVPGFKERSRVFAQLAAPDGTGLGTSIVGQRTTFTAGKLEKTGGPFDLAISGPGLLRIIDASGATMYTRSDSFSRSADGSLRDANGRRLADIVIPPQATSVSVDRSGMVTAHTSAGEKHLGRIYLYAFDAPDALRRIDGATFAQTSASGSPLRVDCGPGKTSTLHFGMLEKSNVSIIASMMELLTAQRAYEADAKGVQAADEMLRIADNLNRG